MDLHLNLLDGELDIILEALKMTAEKYGKDRIDAFLSGETKMYFECGEKKSRAWQAYSHIRRAAEIESHR